MDDDAYEAFVESAYTGDKLVGVDRVFARKLYTDVSASTIEHQTGEAPHLEKAVIWGAFIGAPVSMVASAALAIAAFRWWALLVVPVTFVYWGLNKSASVRGGSRLWPLTVLLVVAASIALFRLLPNAWYSGFLVIYAAALWLDRALYCASTAFLRLLVLRNRRAFDAFAEGITLRTRSAESPENPAPQTPAHGTITRMLGIVISDYDAGRITREHLLAIFQAAIDNGDILSEDNALYAVSHVLPLVDAGVLRTSIHLRSVEHRMDQAARDYICGLRAKNN